MDIIKKMLKMNLSKYDFIIIKSAGSDYYKIGCSKLHGTKKEADETRDKIFSLGYNIEDAPEGTKLIKR